MTVLFIFLGLGACILCLNWLLILRCIAKQKSVDTRNIAYILVLGAALKEGRITRTLEQRLMAAEAFLRARPAARAILCGGLTGKNREAEAVAMKRWLCARGIPSERLLLEDQSRNTMENFRFARKRFLSRYQGRVAVVTSSCHMYRSLKMAQKVGLRAVGVCAKMPARSLIKNYLREMLAIVKYYLIEWFGKSSEASF